MISLTCTNCRTVLQIDDGFAGGVCRCQHCGAIQTVPSHLKKRAASPTSPQPAATKPKAAKTLYSRSGAHGGGVDTGPSSGLDELAHVVASSGLESGRLRSKTVELSSKPATHSQTPLVIAVAALAVAVIGVGLFFALRGGAAQQPQQPTNPAGPANSTVAVSPSPSNNSAATGGGGVFCGVALPDRTVIYVLDRGSGTADLFSYLKEATFRSIQSIGPDRKFKVIFWNNGSDDAFPAGNPTFATPANLESARRALDGVFASGQTDVGTALAQAVNSKPDVIILATGKGWQLDDAFVDQVMKVRGDKPIKIHTFTLGGSEISAPLKTIAQRTGGQSVLVTEADIKQAANQ